MTKIRFIIDILSLKVRNLQHLRYLTLLVLLQKIVKSFLQKDVLAYVRVIHAEQISFYNFIVLRKNNSTAED